MHWKSPSDRLRTRVTIKNPKQDSEGVFFLDCLSMEASRSGPQMPRTFTDGVMRMIW